MPCKVFMKNSCLIIYKEVPYRKISMRQSLLYHQGTRVNESQLSFKDSPHKLRPVTAKRVKIAPRLFSSVVLSQDIKRNINPKVETPLELRIAPWSGSPVQVEALARLKDRLNGKAKGSVDEEIIKWFLRDRRFNVDEAEYKLKRMIKWRESIDIENIKWEDVCKEAKTGTNSNTPQSKVVLLSQRDILNRPIIAIRADRHIPKQFTLTSSQKLLAYMLQTTLDKCKDEMGFESVLVIFDLRGLKSENVDIDFIRFVIDMLFLYYPRRMGQCLLLEAPWFFKPLWKMVEPLLKKYAALARFVSKDELRRDYFLPGNTPEEFR